MAESIVSVALIIAFFSKSKECPRPVRVAVMDFISIYLWLLLPSAILIVNGYDDWMLLGIEIVFGVVVIITNFIYEKVKEDAETNIESMQEMKEEAGESKAELVEALFRDRWRVVNKLCDIYYEKSDSAGAMKFIVRDIEAELEGLRTQESIRDILATADRCLDGEISRLQQECGEFLKEQDIEFVGLIYAGLSVRAVCYLTGLRKANFYQKKNRLMKRIAESDAPSREEFVERLAKFIK
ncbi:MAG: hypothetical protein K2M49_04550 [Muribaculaceae bacterium]|nr:hypothetical protein [Muribaculaceae bacterium]